MSFNLVQNNVTNFKMQHLKFWDILNVFISFEFSYTEVLQMALKWLIKYLIPNLLCQRMNIL